MQLVVFNYFGKNTAHVLGSRSLLIQRSPWNM